MDHFTAVAFSAKKEDLSFPEVFESMLTNEKIKKFTPTDICECIEMGMQRRCCLEP
jgi:hypothetical protein